MSALTRQAALPQPVQPGSDGLPHCDPFGIAGQGQFTNPLGHMERRMVAEALLDRERAGPKVLLIRHARPSSAKNASCRLSGGIMSSREAGHIIRTRPRLRRDRDVFHRLVAPGVPALLRRRGLQRSQETRHYRTAIAAMLQAEHSGQSPHDNAGHRSCDRYGIRRRRFFRDGQAPSRPQRPVEIQRLATCGNSSTSPGNRMPCMAAPRQLSCSDAFPSIGSSAQRNHRAPSRTRGRPSAAMCKRPRYDCPLPRLSRRSVSRAP